eukprot:Gb_14238 [translate_table: standard]
MVFVAVLGIGFRCGVATNSIIVERGIAKGSTRGTVDSNARVALVVKLLGNVVGCSKPCTIVIVESLSYVHPKGYVILLENNGVRDMGEKETIANFVGNVAKFTQCRRLDTHPLCCGDWLSNPYIWRSNYIRWYHPGGS